MSQEKVDRYKKEKANRKKIMAKEKFQHRLAVLCSCLVLVAILGWAGYSAYGIYEKNITLDVSKKVVDLLRKKGR